MMAIVSEPTPGAPGGHARRIVLRLRLRTLIALGLLAIQTTFAGRAFGLRSPLFIGSELLLLLCIFIVSRYVLPLVDRHDRGAKGEEHVGSLLDGLSDEGWRIIHDASFGRGDIDHIAIGPGGVFAVETKSHPGPIAVASVHGRLLRQASAQRRLLERIVELPVEPLIVYSRAWVDRPLASRKGVRLLPARLLLRHLRSSPASLSAEQIQDAHGRVLAAIAAAELADERDGRSCNGARRGPLGALASPWSGTRTRGATGGGGSFSTRVPRNLRRH